ncbi:LacI family DNA-binding transcriptional regulator [Humibacter albus]|uniref:LacI family DNA-binding transcriptional regulator n=1 Tax=Humibacter albus TaxID=427754 RepID=UPI0003B555B7|nr:LacI family DNA-binding transcriptional regulator [Humibacter albus]
MSDEGTRSTAPRRKRVTIMEVAGRAGVSHQTVSRYLRFNGGLKPVTVEKIETAIRELDYKPDLIARSMRTGRSNRIAIVLPELTYYLPMPFQGATAAAHEAGYEVDVVSLEGDEERRRQRVITLMDSERVEGVLSLTPLGDMLETPTGSSAPIVVVGQYDDKMRSTGAFADGAFAAEVIQHLANLGHRRFLHVAGDQRWASARNRLLVYQEAITSLGLESYGVVGGQWTTESGYNAARDLPANSGVTAVFAAKDTIAFGVIRGLQDRGLRVPDDVSVVGWDNDEFARFCAPTLTTVEDNLGLIGRQSMLQLIALIEGKEPPQIPQEIIGRLIPRASSGPAPH